MANNNFNNTENIIFKTLNSANTRNIWFSLDLLEIFSLLNLKKKVEINNFLNETFEILIQIGKKFDNCFIAAFNNDFPKCLYFNTLLSKPYIGSFSKFIFSKKYKFRTLHPFYSFYNFGNSNSDFEENKYIDSFGENSIFNFMIKNKFKLITLGHHYVKSFPIIHHIENLINVNYRKEVFFKGVISDNKNEFINKFNYYFRKIDICDGSGLTFNALTQLSLNEIVHLKKFKIKEKNIYSYQVDLNKCTDYILTKHSENNILVDYFHEENFHNKNFVNDSDGKILYRKLLN